MLNCLPLWSSSALTCQLGIQTSSAAAVKVKAKTVSEAVIRLTDQLPYFNRSALTATFARTLILLSGDVNSPRVNSESSVLFPVERVINWKPKEVLSRQGLKGQPFRSKLL